MSNQTTKPFRSDCANMGCHKAQACTRQDGDCLLLPAPNQTTVADELIGKAIDFAPGTFGCHEALHMAHVLAEMVDEKLCEHPAIQLNPEWRSKADFARRALFDLYQSIGAAHL